MSKRSRTRTPLAERMDYKQTVDFLLANGFHVTNGPEYTPPFHGRGRGEYIFLTNGEVNALVADEKSSAYGNNCLMMECSCFWKWNYYLPFIKRLPVGAPTILTAVKFLSTKEGVEYSRHWGPEGRHSMPHESRWP
jgi:hypothetical protein